MQTMPPILPRMTVLRVCKLRSIRCRPGHRSGWVVNEPCRYARRPAKTSLGEKPRETHQPVKTADTTRRLVDRDSESTSTYTCKVVTSTHREYRNNVRVYHRCICTYYMEHDIHVHVHVHAIVFSTTSTVMFFLQALPLQYVLMYTARYVHTHVPGAKPITA